MCFSVLESPFTSFFKYFLFLCWSFLSFHSFPRHFYSPHWASSSQGWHPLFSPWKCVTFFLILHTLSDFRVFPRHCECYVVESLDTVIFLLRVRMHLFQQAINLVKLKIKTLPCLWWVAAQTQFHSFILDESCFQSALCMHGLG